MTGELLPLDPIDDALARVRVVLVRSRSPGNVGSAARAMLNFGLVQLRVVELPDFDDPSYFETESRKLAWRAARVLDGARFHPDLDQALVDTTLAFGTAPRELSGTPTLSPREAAARLIAEARAGREVALVFGGEADGLRKRELSRLDGLIRIPTGPTYQDLNLAQSVVVCAYELFLAAGAPQAPREPPSPDEEPLPHHAEGALFESIRQLLTEVGFLKEEGTAMADELQRRLASRQVTRREATLLRGMVSQIRWAIRGEQ